MMTVSVIALHLLASIGTTLPPPLASIERELPGLAWLTMIEAGCNEAYADDPQDDLQQCISGWYHWAHKHLMYGEPCDKAWVNRTRQPACRKALAVGIHALRYQGSEGFAQAEAGVRTACRQEVLCGS